MQVINCRAAIFWRPWFSLWLRRGGENVTNNFGFTGPEIFPIDDQIGLLHAADLDGDGLNDLVVANNLRSKISLLYNQTGKNQSGRRHTAAQTRNQ